MYCVFHFINITKIVSLKGMNMELFVIYLVIGCKTFGFDFEGWVSNGYYDGADDYKSSYEIKGIQMEKTTMDSTETRTKDNNNSYTDEQDVKAWVDLFFMYKKHIAVINPFTSYDSGCKEEMIIKWEEEHSATLPDFYKQIIRRSNGAWIDVSTHILALEEIQSVHKGIMSVDYVIASVDANLVYSDQNGNISIRNKKTGSFDAIDAESFLNLITDQMLRYNIKPKINVIESEERDASKSPPKPIREKLKRMVVPLLLSIAVSIVFVGPPMVANGMDKYTVIGGSIYLIIVVAIVVFLFIYSD